ncbi:heme peroxidase family protein [Ahrensia sp. R2A130]|uniref:peroxidase family protein n=1 Tax=Ahrensia sp. R2A130 TaxID=744979 RepID=UPI0001E0E117|nr:heme peroxidase family protein [Ahrensia sp. R2A130]EFL87558.1 heme peroxidase [Ahrensia sp. R2A130]
MTLIVQTHGSTPQPEHQTELLAATPEGADVSVDAQADFGYIFRPSGNPDHYLPAASLDELDALGNLMVFDPEDQIPNSTLPPLLTYWGQFLDHELSAKTDRDNDFTNIEIGDPTQTAETIEQGFKNARTPRFDLDSIYGGTPIGPGIGAEIATIISGMRHPDHPEKMRVRTTDGIDLPDGLDKHRDLPRFSQVSDEVRQAYLKLAKAKLDPQEFEEFRDKLPKRAIIGDMRNDENLIVAQFHLSFLRFHNKVIDFLQANDTGWVADFGAAKTLTKLHYQWLIANVYLPNICDPDVVERVLQSRAKHFFSFRDAHRQDNNASAFGHALPLEFSGAAFRFAHTMVRAGYDYNRNFGLEANIIPSAEFDALFAFTGGGGLGEKIGLGGNETLPGNWVIDWNRFLNVQGPQNDETPGRSARPIDTQIAPPLAKMLNEGEEEGISEAVKAMMKQLARRNLRRGFSLRLPTGQALHEQLHADGVVTSAPQADVTAWLDNKPDVADFMRNSSAKLHERTPLWFYCLAEAEAGGGNQLGEVGSFLVASTFLGTLFADPDSALSTRFDPIDSPLKTPEGQPIDSMEAWMKFALVLE